MKHVPQHQYTNNYSINLYATPLLVRANNGPKFYKFS